jgi:hypothetical protein
MNKQEYVISMTVMPWEMEQFIEMTAQLRRNSYYLNLEEVDFIFDVTFNLSDDVIDWEKSQLPKQYYIDQFNALMIRYDWTSKNNVTFHEKGSYGCVDKRRESTDNYSDETNIIWLDPDMTIPDTSLHYLVSTVNAIDSEYYIITPEMTKRWDITWDLLVSDHYKDVNHDDWLKIDPYQIYYVNSNLDREIEVTVNDTLDTVPFGNGGGGIKFGGGMLNLFSNKLLKLIRIPENVPSYGIEDLYTMMGISWLMAKGLDIKQYILRNVVVSENRQYVQSNDIHKKYLEVKLSRAAQRASTDDVNSEILQGLLNKLEGKYGKLD